MITLFDFEPINAHGWGISAQLHCLLFLEFDLINVTLEHRRQKEHGQKADYSTDCYRRQKAQM